MKVLSPNSVVVKYKTFMKNLEPKGQLQEEAKRRFENHLQHESIMSDGLNCTESKSSSVSVDSGRHSKCHVRS